jgi:hypothetical protein
MPKVNTQLPLAKLPVYGFSVRQQSPSVVDGAALG